MTVSVGGEIGEVGKAELDRGRAAGLPRRPPARARPARARRDRDQQGQRPDRHLARRRRPARRDRRRRSRSTSTSIERLGAVARDEYGLAGTVQHGASTLPDELFHRLPRGRDGRDPPRDRLPERALRAPRVPAPSSTRRSRAGASRTPLDERKAGPDRPAVRLHDAQEGDRPVQARAVGPRDEGRDPRRPGAPRSASCSTSSGSSAVAGDGRPVRPPGRAPPAGARRAIAEAAATASR